MRPTSGALKDRLEVLRPIFGVELTFSVTETVWGEFDAPPAVKVIVAV